MSAPRLTYSASHEAWLTPNQAAHTTQGGGTVKFRYLRSTLTCRECLYLGWPRWEPRRPHASTDVTEPHMPACMAFVPRKETP